MGYRTFVLAISLALFGSTTAQTNVRGTLVDEHDQGLPFASLSFTAGDRTVTTETDEAGSFSSFALTPGTWRLVAELIGYDGIDSSIVLTEGENVLHLHLPSRAGVLPGLEVVALRADERTPMAQTTVTKQELRRNDVGTDLPYLLDQQPSVVTTSDGGTGIGYTGIRIRGTDATRVNATINGVPLNGAEDQTVYWVDLPDFASSTEDVQVQRGVGTSTNGPGAFGGSINLRTDKVCEHPFAEVTAGGGSFNTQRLTAKAGTGLIDDRFAFDARLSTSKSDGYIDRASSDLRSYFLQGAWIGKRQSLRFITFSGHEVTYQAWAGVPKDSLATNRTFNPYTYKDQVDDYTQTYYQLLFDHQLGKSSLLNITLFRVDGKGYYEEFKDDQDPNDYGITIPSDIGLPENAPIDVIRQRWLDNTLMGVNASVKSRFGKHELIVGGSAMRYDGEHYGEVLWSEYISPNSYEQRYYEDDARKDEANLFAKFTYALGDRVDLYGDVQARNVHYDFTGFGDDLSLQRQHATLSFFNPKAGIVVRVHEGGRAYASIAVANKEPNRDDFVNATPQSRPHSESLYDGELGYEWKRGKNAFGIDAYWMDYSDQLVLTGQLNDVGDYTRVNVPKSYRAGVELTGAVQIVPRLRWKANATFSQNKVRAYTEYVDDWDTGLQHAIAYSGTDLSFSPSVIAASEWTWRFVESDRAGHADIALVSKFVGQQYLDNSQSAERSLDPYFVNDLRLNWSLTHVKGVKEIMFTFAVRNLFNELYESNGWTYRYVYGGTESADIGYYPQAGTNVLGGVTVRF